MSDLIWLTQAQMLRIEPYFPLSHGVPRVDDRRVISGIVFVLRNGLRWRDAPKAYGPHKTIYNRFVRWSRLGVFIAHFWLSWSSSGLPWVPIGIPWGRLVSSWGNLGQPTFCHDRARKSPPGSPLVFL